MKSEEVASITGFVDGVDRSDAEAFVAALYAGILERPASPKEIEAWSSAFVQGSGSSLQIARRMLELFIRSDERNTMAEHRDKVGAGELFAPPGHFYSPVVARDEAKKLFDRLSTRPLPETLPGLDISRESMVARWTELLPHLRAVPLPAHPTPGFRYCYENPAYSYGDGATLYAMIARHRPRQIIEIGCGWSSVCMLDALDRELPGQCRITFIEPYPELLRQLGQGAIDAHRLIASPIQDVDLSEFRRLEAGDILFIDSTHVLKTGSDVTYELLHVLPALKPGVLVHFHDVFWPFEYPREWAVDDNRSWDEIYALQSFLSGNRDWSVEFMGNYMTSVEPDRVKRDFPTMLKNPGGAIWLRRRGGA